MSKPKRKTRSFSHFRRTQMAVRDREFCIIWINKMVNKQVEKHIARVRAEFSLLSQELREQMADEIRKQLREPAEKEPRVHSKHYTVLFTEDEDEKESVDQITLSSNSSETHGYTNRIYKKSPKPTADDNLRSLLEGSADSGSNHTILRNNEAMQNSTDAHRNPHQAERQLMETEWAEWMDVQEWTGNLKENPYDQQNSRKQGGPHEPDNPVKEIRVEPTNTMKKIRTYINNFFNPHRHNMWKKLEEDD